MQSLYETFSNPWIILIIVVWSLVWKGLALWKSARGGQKAWFVAMLLLSTLGLVEIIYLAFFAPKKKSEITTEKSI